MLGEIGFYIKSESHDDKVIHMVSKIVQVYGIFTDIDIHQWIL